VEKWAEAIRKADPTFDFRRFDANRDGTLQPTELGVLVVIPQSSPFGTNRGVVGVQVPAERPLVVDGVVVPVVAEWYTGLPVNAMVAAHELVHLVLGDGDLYFTFFQPFAAASYSLMDQTYNRGHLDPLSKVKHGWARPRLVLRSGRYSLASVATQRTVLVLLDPSRSTDEYFLVENRWRGGSAFDTSIPDQGLAVWRVTESQQKLDAMGPPPNVTPTLWASVGGSRRGLRLLRPFTDPATTWGARQLWDASVGYDLLSRPAQAGHTALTWADGSPSGFSITDMSGEGAVMQLTITVP